MKKVILVFFSIIETIFSTYGQNSTIAGEISIPYPTIKNIAIEWLIEGDINLNGIVFVHYRKKGESEWKEAMPLRRVPAGENLGFTWKNKFSGSIFNLAPGTEYEIKLNLIDPDGGNIEKIVTATTRPVPKIPEGAKITDIPAGNYGILSPENGTQSSPRVYRSLDGSATFDFVDLQNKEWVYIWGLTINSSGKNSVRAIKADGAKNCVIRYCNITGLYGITAYGKGMTNCYIGDNIIIGKCIWANEAMGADGKNEGEGIQITGPGNVICHNLVKGFRDCISTMEDEEAFNQICIDIYNNDLYVGVDDAIEADFCQSNCRVMNNRITNCYVGVSSQPGLGGPNYFIRNVMYNIIHAAFKFKRNSRGDVALHNTIVKIGAGLAGNDAMDFAYFRNNLAFGGPTGDIEWGGYGAGNPYAADIRDPGSHSSFDYDAVGVWGVTYVAKIGGKPFAEVEPHGIGNIKFEEIFPNIPFPYPPVPEREVVDLRPNKNSSIIDKGEIIPNINDNYLGSAPDCGAYEAEQSLPLYGPRPIGIDEENYSGNSLHKDVRSNNLPGIKISSIKITSSFLVIKYLGDNRKVRLSIIDLLGREQKILEDYKKKGVHTVFIPLKRFPVGCYFLCLKAQGSHILRSFVVR